MEEIRFGQLETDGAPCQRTWDFDFDRSSPNKTAPHGYYGYFRSDQIEGSTTSNLEKGMKSLTITPSPAPRIQQEPTSQREPTQEEQVIGLIQYMQYLYQGDIEGDTLLHRAIINEEPQSIAHILEYTYIQQALDMQNNQRQTALHLAAADGQTQIARTLLAHGTDPTIQDTAGRTPLHVACEKGDMAMVVALTKPVQPEESSAAKYTVCRHHVPQEGEIRDFQGQTCVHVAAKLGRTDIVKHLVDHCNHDINAQETGCGKTVFHMAVDASDTDMVEFLLRHRDMDPSIEDYRGLSGLMAAHYHPKSLAVIHSVFPRNKRSLEKSFYEMVAKIEEDEYGDPGLLKDY